MYTVDRLPEPLLSFEQYNPMALYLNMFREVVIYGTFPSGAELAMGATLAVGALVGGWIIFTRLEDKFAYQF